MCCPPRALGLERFPHTGSCKTSKKKPDTLRRIPTTAKVVPCGVNLSALTPFIQGAKPPEDEDVRLLGLMLT